MELNVRIADQIEKHPIRVIAVACMTVASAVFAVTQYFHLQHVQHLADFHAADIAKFETQLARLQVGVDGDGFLDVNNLIVESSEPEAIPSESTFYPFDSFYALESDANWKYRKTTEEQLLREISGLSYESVGLKEAAELAPVHMWASKNSFDVIHEGTRSSVPTMILVQRFPIPKLEQLFQMLTHSETEQNEKPNVLQVSYNETDSDENERLVDSFMDDLTGKFFQFQLWLDLGVTINSRLTSHQLNRVNKLDDVLYSNSTVIMREAIVDGKDVPAFYLHNEMILISNQQGLYLIKIVLPSTEPIVRQSSSASVKRWLSSLKIVVP